MTVDKMQEQNWPFFKRDELKCRFTNECAMSPEFMTKVVMLRNRFGKPMVVTSAYRHIDHPAEKSKIAKGKKAGWHNAGRAIDILVCGTDAWQLVRYATEMGLSIGINQRGLHAQRYIHIDDRPPPQMIWSY